MKKFFLTGVSIILAIVILSSCGGSRKLGCPAQANNKVHVKSVV